MTARNGAKRSRRRLLILGIIALAAALYFVGHDYLTIPGVKAHLATARSVYHAHPVSTVALFMAAQVAALAVCLPGAVLAPSLAAGALFGPWLGSAIVLSAVTIGDSLGFLLARHAFRDLLAKRYERQIARIGDDRGTATLLALRMMAIVPYFVVNIAMALTRMPLRIFAPISFVGLIPATILYVRAGAEIARIERASDIWTPPMLAAFAAIGLLPFVARWAYRRWREGTE